MWEAEDVAVAVSTDGYQFVAYSATETLSMPLTFAEWFHSPVMITRAIEATKPLQDYGEINT